MPLKYLGFLGLENTSSSKKHYPTVIEELCHHFSLEDLRKSTNNFDEKLLIAQGIFGKVYKGCLKHYNGVTDYTIALRVIAPKSNQDFSLFKKEVELLCQLHHPNLVSLIGFCNRKKKKILVYEYMANGSLHDYMLNKDLEPLSWKKRLEICLGVARGIHYMHSGVKRIIFHRDIKTTIILLDNNMLPKLSAFALSLQGPLSTSKPKPVEAVVCGTRGYVAPEYVSSGKVTDKCDVYSFGMVLLQVVCTKDKQIFIEKAMLASQQRGECANDCSESFTDYLPLNVRIFLEKFPIEEIIDPTLKGKIALVCWEVFVNIIQRCLKHEPDERPTMGEIEVLLEHALALQEEADIRKTDDGDYTLSSPNYIDIKKSMLSPILTYRRLRCS